MKAYRNRILRAKTNKLYNCSQSTAYAHHTIYTVRFFTKQTITTRTPRKRGDFIETNMRL